LPRFFPEAREKVLFVGEEKARFIGAFPILKTSGFAPATQPLNAICHLTNPDNLLTQIFIGGTFPLVSRLLLIAQTHLALGPWCD
jgi:hypothetical protein